MCRVIAIKGRIPKLVVRMFTRSFKEGCIFSWLLYPMHLLAMHGGRMFFAARTFSVGVGKDGVVHARMDE